MGSHLRLFSTGDIVDVAPAARVGCPNSDGGRAFIVAVNNDNSINVKYVVDRKISKEVQPSRVKVATIGTTARLPSANNNVLPSILSPKYAVAKKAAEFNAAEVRTSKPKKVSNTKTTEDLLTEAPIEIHQYLRKKNNIACVLGCRCKTCVKMFEYFDLVSDPLRVVNLRDDVGA